MMQKSYDCICECMEKIIKRQKEECDYRHALHMSNIEDTSLKEQSLDAIRYYNLLCTSYFDLKLMKQKFEPSNNIFSIYHFGRLNETIIFYIGENRKIYIKFRQYEDLLEKFIDENIRNANIWFEKFNFNTYETQGLYQIICAAKLHFKSTIKDN